MTGPIHLIVDRNVRSFWSPASREIVLGSGYTPLEAGHEIAHARLGHDLSGSALADIVQERDAWMETLRRIPPEEISTSEIRRSLSSYLHEIADTYGRSSRQHLMAKKLCGGVIDYARKRKKEE